MTRINPGTLIVSALLLAGIAMMLANSNFTIPPGALLIGGLLIAATTLLGGEYLIKKWTLTDRAASVARSAAAVMALIIGIGTIFPFWNGAMPNISWMSALYTYATQDLGRAVQVLAIILVGSTVIYGAYRELKTSSGDTAIFFWRVAFVIIVALAILTWLIGTNRMAQVGSVVQNSARTQLDIWLNGGPMLPDVDPGMLALGFLGLAFLIGLWKMKIIQMATMVTGAIIWLPFIAWLAWGSLPADYKQGVTDTIGTVTGAAEEVYESLPMVGEDHYVNLATAYNNATVVSDIGPHDTVTLYITRGPCIDWEPTDQWLRHYGNAPWYDPNQKYLTKIRGGNGIQRTYAFTEEFSEGLQAANATLQLEIWLRPC